MNDEELNQEDINKNIARIMWDSWIEDKYKEIEEDKTKDKTNEED
tara:strand:+ start:2356 stop:2490 length:135 start_codon:yes stop_codon:yes gene_type:complete